MGERVSASARLGRIPVAEAALARWDQDRDPSERDPVWEQDGCRFRVIRTEPARVNPLVTYLVVIPIDPGPNPNWRGEH